VRYYGPGGPGEGEGLSEGDVLLSNHPQLAGGSHLPDITVITPVFSGGRIVFFVARWGRGMGGEDVFVHSGPCPQAGAPKSAPSTHGVS
jgi:5-oxoprolinase (ATP-hydrolysing)